MKKTFFRLSLFNKFFFNTKVAFLTFSCFYKKLNRPKNATLNEKKNVITENVIFLEEMFDNTKVKKAISLRLEGWRVSSLILKNSLAQNIFMMFSFDISQNRLTKIFKGGFVWTKKFCRISESGRQTEKPKAIRLTPDSADSDLFPIAIESNWFGFLFRNLFHISLWKVPEKTFLRPFSHKTLLRTLQKNLNLI